MVDIATRVYNHKWRIDPIVRSLIDTDFYKLLMCQSVFRNKPDTIVTFSLINRSPSIRLADLVDEGELREQLDHIRTLRLSRGESTFLRGNTFYGKRQMFRPDFMEWFENFTLPPYHLEKRDGQYELTFEGRWPEVMMWEIPALAVLMELRSRAVLKSMGRFELQVLYARAMTKLWEKVERLRPVKGLRLGDFGTRRRHSFLWQDWAVQALQEGLGEKFVGTSNCLIAMRREVEAIGTNAHELPMVYSALAKMMPNWLRRRFVCWRIGTKNTMAICGSFCPIPMALRAFWSARPIGLRNGQAFASIPATLLRGPRRRSVGGRRVVKIRPKNW